MRNEYDFSRAKPTRYPDRLKKAVTIRLDEATISYFRQLADESGLPYQTLINLYLRDCATTRRALRRSRGARPARPKAVRRTRTG